MYIHICVYMYEYFHYVYLKRVINANVNCRHLDSKSTSKHISMESVNKGLHHSDMNGTHHLHLQHRMLSWVGTGSGQLSDTGQHTSALSTPSDHCWTRGSLRKSPQGEPLVNPRRATSLDTNIQGH